MKTISTSKTAKAVFLKAQVKQLKSANTTTLICHRHISHLYNFRTEEILIDFPKLCRMNIFYN